MSEALANFQQKIGAKPDGSFGPNTAKAIKKHFALSPERAAHLLGQVIHESGSFKYVRENLNYSVQAMMKVWPSRFPTEESAEPYARNPEKLAEKVYGGRMGNPPGMAGKFLGRGFLQLTGYNNIKAFSDDMGDPEILENPEIIETKYPMDTAVWFFQKNGLWKIADNGVNDDTIKRITKKINGGTIGLDHRMKETKKIFTYLI